MPTSTSAVIQRTEFANRHRYSAALFAFKAYELEPNLKKYAAAQYQSGEPQQTADWSAAQLQADIEDYSAYSTGSVISSV